MGSFLYSFVLKLLYPTSVCLLLIIAGLLFRNRRKLSFWLHAGAAAVLLLAGNGWVGAALVRGLESQCIPAKELAKADAILILSGGIHGRIAPRQTVEVGDAGDRVLYGAYLYRKGLASRVICTGNVATGGKAQRPVAEEMSELLGSLGVPMEAVILETKSTNTREHARNLNTLFEEHGMTNVILVTSAIHMPRSLGVFKKHCPMVTFIPAPTDFILAEQPAKPWYTHASALVPTPRNLLVFSDAVHEYLGMAYYKLRGWI